MDSRYVAVSTVAWHATGHSNIPAISYSCWASIVRVHKQLSYPYLMFFLSNFDSQSSCLDCYGVRLGEQGLAHQSFVGVSFMCSS